jgi:hypothetical protein
MTNWGVVMSFHTGTMKESSFQPLEEYMREKYVFSLLRRIPFFGQYLCQKAYDVWKKYVGQRKFNRVRSSLSKKFFFAKPQFIGALMKVYAYICELRELPLVHVSQNHLHQLDEFCHLQVELQKHKAIADVDAIAEKCQVVLAKICEEAKRQAQIYRVKKFHFSPLNYHEKSFLIF